MEKKGNRLSPIPYIRHNKGRTMALIISLSAFALLIYALSCFVALFYEPAENCVLGLFEKISIASIRVNVGDYETNDEWDEKAKKVCAETAEDLKKITGNDDILVVRRRYFYINLPAGQTGTEMIFFENKEDMDRYSDLVGAKIVEGRMPEAPGELVVSTKVYQNRGEDLLSNISEGYKIVGKIDADYYVFYGYPIQSENNYCFMIFNKTKDEDDKALIEEAGYEVGGFTNYKSVHENLENEREVFGNIKMVFTLVSTILLSICIVVVLSLHIRDRHEEWCLFNSIGFSVSEIYILAMKELIISFSGALAVGSIMSTIAILIFKIVVCDPLGISARFFRPDDIFRVILSFFVIFALCQIPLFLQLRKITTVDDIE